MKIALIADPHFNLWRKNNSFFKYLMDFFLFFIKFVNEQNIEYIIFAGDLFHTKSVISAEMLLKTTAIFKLLNKKCRNVKFIYIIPGNHDIYLRKDSSWNILHIYNEFQKVKVFHDLNSIIIDNVNLWFMPFMRNSKEYVQCIEQIKLSKQYTNILISHIGVNGFTLLQTEDISIAEQNDFITVDTFKKFDHVFLGHLHGYQTNKNITYISSPIQSRHGDEYGKHGFIIYDSDTNNYEFIENKTTPKFSTIKFNNDNIKKLLDTNGKNQFIRLVVDTHIESSKLSSIIEKLKNKEYSVDLRFNLKNEFDFDDSIASIKNWDEIVFNSTEELFKKFLDYIDTDLNKDDLYKFITSLNIEKEGV